MGDFSTRSRVLTATLFSIVLVAGAYILARDAESPSLAQASAETALLQAIATRDSSGDGLPDWQKALYGIPIHSTTTDYFNLGMTDGEAVARGLIVPKAITDIAVATSSAASTVIDPSLPPAAPEGALTNAFAKSFFALYLNAKKANNGVELSPAQIDDLSNQALNSLSALITVAPDYVSANTLTLSNSDNETLKTFIESVGSVLQKNKSASGAVKSEILYLQDALEKNDTDALSHLVALAKMYRDTAAGLAALPVPKELADDYLVLINRMMRLSGMVSDFARVNVDPLATVLALEQYAEPDQPLADALTHFGSVYGVAGITLPAGTPGAQFLQAVSQHPATAGTSTL